MKHVLSLCLMVLSVSVMAQQRPVINSLSKTSGTVGETIVINGSGFGTTAANIRVFFGTGLATVQSVSSSQITVTVPASATYGPVTVTDVTTRLSGESLQRFLLSFSGESLTANQLDAQLNFPSTNQDAYDVCACDFNLDGLMDAALTSNPRTGTAANRNASFYQNTSSGNTVSFTRISENIGINTINADCGDLNGDGRADAVFASNVALSANHIFIFQNTSVIGGSVNMSLILSLRLPTLQNGTNRSARKVQIADIDGDGRNDIVVGNEVDNAVVIYRNITSGTNIAFNATPTIIPVTGATTTGSLSVADLNNDGSLDIAVLPTGQANQRIYLLENTSSGGSFSFNIIAIGAQAQRTEILATDLNGDNIAEIITTRFSVTNPAQNIVEIFPALNARFEYGNVINKSASRPWGISVGDLNGDGHPDIATASVLSGVDVFLNTTTGNTLSFADRFNKQATASGDARNIKIVDINADAKPDILFTHNTELDEFTDLSVIPNRACVVPEISPDPAGLSFCFNSPFELEGTRTLGASYQWTALSGTVAFGSPTSRVTTVTVTSGSTVNIQLTITANDASGCTNATTETYTLTGGTEPTAPTITPNQAGVICSGSDLTLQGPAGFTTYLWTLLDGATVTQATPNLVLTGVTSADAGQYTLRVQQTGACFSAPGSFTVTIDEPPFTVINNLGEDVFCEGGTTTLQVPQYAGFTYQWKRNGTNVGTNQNSFTANVSGNYTVALRSGAGCENESSAYALNVVPPPTSALTSAADEICVNVPLDFQDTSEGADGFALSYSWNWDDGTAASTTADATHTFATPGTYDVVLTTSYTDLPGCEDTSTRSITVAAVPTIDITVVGGSLEKCPEDSIRLELPTNFQSYEWSTGATDFFAYARTTGSQSSVDISVDMVTDIGCEVTSEVTISNFANSRIELDAPDYTIANDSIRLPSPVKSLIVEASNGSSYSWTPQSVISFLNLDSSRVSVYPRTQFTTVSVTGIDAVNSCETTRNLTVVSPGILPRNSFSPNGDGLGYDCWEILNSESLTGCTIYIFDQKGSYVFRGTSPFPNNCVWNGNLDNGTVPVPEGVYFYVLKCDNADTNQTGTILLAR